MAGSQKENPRYRVVSTRLSETEREMLDEQMKLSGMGQTEYLRLATMEKVARDTAMKGAS